RPHPHQPLQQPSPPPNLQPPLPPRQLQGPNIHHSTPPPAFTPNPGSLVLEFGPPPRPTLRWDRFS
ncbi:hypothetical protein MTX36_29690, partial [Rhodococcus sp. ARC_M6]|nr:hypothetical protein [Rhodococcus sp. ARC_M6]